MESVFVLEGHRSNWLVKLPTELLLCFIHVNRVENVHIVFFLIKHLNFFSTKLILVHNLLLLRLSDHLEAVLDELVSFLLLLLNSELISLIIDIDTLFGFESPVLPYKNIVSSSTIHKRFDSSPLLFLNLPSNFSSFSLGPVPSALSCHLHVMKLQVINSLAVVSISSALLILILLLILPRLEVAETQHVLILVNIPIQQFVMHTVIIWKLPFIIDTLDQIVTILFTLQVNMRH